MSTSVRALIDLDQDLAAAVPEERRDAARRAVRARTRTVERGAWDAIGEYGECADWMGLLVIDGFLSRRTSCGEETVGEIVGPGDLLRPWDHDGEYPVVEDITTSWQVLEEITIALLDAKLAARLAEWPALTAAILARIGRRDRWLGLRLLVSQLPGVELRVLYFLWHLAERWGEATDGVLRTPAPLTHEHIGELIGAQRPSVSHAVGALREQGVRRVPGLGWEMPLDTPATIEAMLEEGAFVPSARP